MARYANLRRISSLDPVADHEEIMRISAGLEFPWDYQKSLEMALFRTYCVPTISGLLERTGEFERRPQKRYDDTAILMAELVEHGYDSPRGREALRVVNRQHGRYDISNDDMRYVLATFIYDPIDWLAALRLAPADAQRTAGGLPLLPRGRHPHGNPGHPGRLRRIPGVQDGLRAEALRVRARRTAASASTRSTCSARGIRPWRVLWSHGPWSRCWTRRWSARSASPPRLRGSAPLGRLGVAPEGFRGAPDAGAAGP